MTQRRRRTGTALTLAPPRNRDIVLIDGPVEQAILLGRHAVARGFIPIVPSTSIEHGVYPDPKEAIRVIARNIGTVGGRLWLVVEQYDVIPPPALFAYREGFLCGFAHRSPRELGRWVRREACLATWDDWSVHVEAERQELGDDLRHVARESTADR